jgi:hypothetical protein
MNDLIKIGFKQKDNGFWLDIGQESFIYYNGESFYLFGPDCPNENYAYRLNSKTIEEIKTVIDALTK